ncbi:MAG: rhodanese-like domain-containing protein [Planctomycetaceae bacterium]
MVATITAKELQARIQAGESVDLIDVRTPAEFREVHANIAKNFPLEKFDVGGVLAQHPGSGPLYVICRSGSRGKQACEKLAAAGCTRAINIEGGTLAWEQAGFPVVRGRKTISLERQVRICAGFMALTGGLLGIFVHPWFAGLSAFVGAGLMFAGITDTCGMALILARMPWNQVSSPPAASSTNTQNCSTQSNATCCG